jgi:hypothetical protein
MHIIAGSPLRFFALFGLALAGPALVVACSSSGGSTTTTGSGTSSHASTGTGGTATGTGGGAATATTATTATSGRGGGATTTTGAGGAITEGTGGGDAGKTCRETCIEMNAAAYKLLEDYELTECACTDAGTPPCATQCTAECAMPSKLKAGTPCATCITGEAKDACIATARTKDCATDTACDPFLTCVAACPGG